MSVYQALSEAITALFSAILPPQELQERIEKFKETDATTASLGMSLLLTFEGGEISKWVTIGEKLKRELEEKGFQVSGTFKRKSKKRVVRSKLMIKTELKREQGSDITLCIVFLLIRETRDDYVETSTIRACKPLSLSS